MRDIGKNIKEFRLRNNYSQEEMAEKLYVTRQTVSNYETGKSRPDLDTLIRIAEIYGVDVNQLIYGENELTGKEIINKAIQIGIGVFLIIIMAVFIHWFHGYSRVITSNTGNFTWRTLFIYVLRPLMSIAMGVIAVIILTYNVKIRPLKKNTPGRTAVLLAFWIILAFTVFLFMISVISLLEMFGVDMRWLGTWLYIRALPELATVFFFENWYWFIILGLAMILTRRLVKE